MTGDAHRNSAVATVSGAVPGHCNAYRLRWAVTTMPKPGERPPVYSHERRASWRPCGLGQLEQMENACGKDPAREQPVMRMRSRSDINIFTVISMMRSIFRHLRPTARPSHDVGAVTLQRKSALLKRHVRARVMAHRLRHDPTLQLASFFDATWYLTHSPDAAVEPGTTRQLYRIFGT